MECTPRRRGFVYLVVNCVKWLPARSLGGHRAPDRDRAGPGRAAGRRGLSCPRPALCPRPAPLPPSLPARGPGCWRPPQRRFFPPARGSGRGPPRCGACPARGSGGGAGRAAVFIAKLLPGRWAGGRYLLLYRVSVRGRRCFVRDNKPLSNSRRLALPWGAVRRGAGRRCCTRGGGAGSGAGPLSPQAEAAPRWGGRQRKRRASGAMAAGGSLSRSERKAAARAEILQQEEQRDRRRQVRPCPARPGPPRCRGPP